MELYLYAGGACRRRGNRFADTRPPLKNGTAAQKRKLKTKRKTVRQLLGRNRQQAGGSGKSRKPVAVSPKKNIVGLKTFVSLRSNTYQRKHNSLVIKQLGGVL